MPPTTFAEPAVSHLLLGAQEAFLVAPAVADPQVALARGREDLVGTIEGQRQRLLDQHRLAERKRLADGRHVLLLRGRHDDRRDLRMGDDGVVVGGMQVGARYIG